MTPDPAGMAAADPANPQSWNRYAYVMNNPLNATDPLGLCYFGDGHTIGTTYPGRVIGEECNSGALDSSNPGGCMTDASCTNSPVGPGSDPAGTPDSYFESFIEQSHAQTFARYQNRADCGYNPGTCDASNPTGYTILVTCGGTFGQLICLPPVQTVDASLSHILRAANGDVPIGMDIFHNSSQCPHCADLWKQADCTLNGSVNDTLKDVGAGATFDTLKGAAGAQSMGTSVVKGVGESLAEGTATSFFAIYTYAKTMATVAWRMVAGCQ